MLPTQKKTVKHKGVICHRFTPSRSKTSSIKLLSHQVGSGLEQSTPTRTEHGNGLMGQPLTSPTGGLASLMDIQSIRVLLVSLPWTFMLIIMVHGRITPTNITLITFASLPFKHCLHCLGLLSFQCWGVVSVITFASLTFN